MRPDPETRRWSHRLGPCWAPVGFAGPARGGAVRVIPEPGVDCLEIQNQCVLTSDKGQHVINVSRREGTNRFKVWGKVWKEGLDQGQRFS